MAGLNDPSEWMRGYRSRFYPTLQQRRYLACAFGVARFVWNWGLATKREAYQKNKSSIDFLELSRRLTALRTEKPWLTEVDRQLQTQSLRDLDRAYQNFFAKRARFPKYKSRNGRPSARFVLDARHLSKVRAWAERKIKLPGLGVCQMADSFPRWPAMPKMVTVRRDACGDYWISFGSSAPELALAPNHTIGVDVGITDLAVTSDGWKSGQLTGLRFKAARLRRYQKRVSRRMRGSHRRKRAKYRLARLHRNIANSRRDFIHKVSHHIATTANTVVLETLNVKGMLCNHHLAKALSDASISELHRQIDYKVTQRGGQVIRVDRWAPSSKLCSSCHKVTLSLPLSVRHWTCAGCGIEHDLDVNAARNLLDLGAGGAEVTRGDWRGSGSAIAEPVRQVEPRISAATYRRMDRRRVA